MSGYWQIFTCLTLSSQQTVFLSGKKKKKKKDSQSWCFEMAFEMARRHFSENELLNFSGWGWMVVGQGGGEGRRRECLSVLWEFQICFTLSSSYTSLLPWCWLHLQHRMFIIYSVYWQSLDWRLTLSHGWPAHCIYWLWKLGCQRSGMKRCADIVDSIQGWIIVSVSHPVGLTHDLADYHCYSQCKLDSWVGWLPL